MFIYLYILPVLLSCSLPVRHQGMLHVVIPTFDHITPVCVWMQLVIAGLYQKRGGGSVDDTQRECIVYLALECLLTFHPPQVGVAVGTASYPRYMI